MISFDEVKRLAVRANVIPLYATISADLDTPVSAYLKIRKAKGESFLLESIEGGEKLARYSFLGGTPFETITGYADSVTTKRGRKDHSTLCSPLTWLNAYFRQFTSTRLENLPRFTGGAVGYFSYDFVRLLEKLPNRHNELKKKVLFRLDVYRDIVVFDHVKQEIIVIANILTEDGSQGLKEKYVDAKSRIEKLTGRLSGAIPRQTKGAVAHAKIKPTITKAAYEQSVVRAKEYIREGDIFQAVLSQRWTARSSASSLDVYRRLRRLNPSPYMFLLDHGDSAVIGSSPEMLVRIENGDIETRPIAGTRPRGTTPERDAALEAELLADKKELAEHTMLVDLGRNDLGRVCKPGTVRLAESMHVERYSHVMHLVSSVAGKMKEGLSPMDGLAACFPAGTVSGAPKIRAMEIIDELETCERGIYSGAVGYIDFWGNVDSCITIRTVVKDGAQYIIQAGAGIVADSVPEREYQECCSKAGVLFEAIGGKKAT
jgi:anthranilate synthase component I